ncbi:hypothetical protein BP5796_01399 [Coleophoma crateriformis]|uniref:Casparian strip membrane protein domain-containing protein n=1 Tax=Coleophoma crateriformis TaxID=565419 RepID=A0A3D8T0B2_9HELO|nr:hypothetical protein BP5796_01399 [Coleophoma crateriformis]
MPESSMETADATARATDGFPLEAHVILQHEKPFPVQRPFTDSSIASSEQPIMAKEKRWADSQSNRSKAYSGSSHFSESTTSTQAENRNAQRGVRTLPPWIASLEEEDNRPSEALRPTDTLLATPSRAHSAQHHYDLANSERRVSQDGFVDEWDAVSGVPERKHETGFFGGHRDPVPGRKWDHARDKDPVIMRSGTLPNSSPWRNFIKASMYGPAEGEEPKQVDERFLKELTPGYEKPWRGDLGDADGDETVYGLLHNKKRRKNFITRAQNTLLLHPFVPLSLRVTVFTTSIISLGISGSVFHLSNTHNFRQSSSTTMAVVVDAVAIPYILYITWDEYTGKPLGLRSPRAKIRLVLLDLFFIIFEAANLALAFGALTDGDGSCVATKSSDFNAVVCHRVRALCAILMIALVAWSLTFAVSIFRLVERVGGREGREEGD